MFGKAINLLLDVFFKLTILICCFNLEAVVYNIRIMWICKIFNNSNKTATNFLFCRKTFVINQKNMQIKDMIKTKLVLQLTLAQSGLHVWDKTWASTECIKNNRLQSTWNVNRQTKNINMKRVIWTRKEKKRWAENWML